MSGLPRASFEIPFDGGLLTRGDKRAKDAPANEALLNVEYEDIGGLRVRFPFGITNNTIQTGGTLTNCRKFDVYNGGVVAFTDTALYSWSRAANTWQPIGTHLAVATDEMQRFTTTDDQFFTDRAELNGFVFYVWQAASQIANTCYLAVVDKATGAVLLNPTSIAVGASRPRVVALDTRILLSYVVTDLIVTSIQPSNPAKSAWHTPVTVIAGLGGGAGKPYDVVRLPGVDTAIVVGAGTGNTSYTIAKVTAACAVTSSSKARACDGAIAVAVTPDAVSAQVIRDDGSTNVKGDLVTVSTLADVFTNTTVGTFTGAFTTLNHTAAAFRSVKVSGQWRCYFFYSAGENGFADNNDMKSGWIDDANNVSASTSFVHGLGVASRAFDYNGSVYVWLAFAGISQFLVSPTLTVTGALQNTYFLYRDDGFLVAKAVDSEAAGFTGLNGLLPGVALVSGTTVFAWCGTERRIVPVSNVTIGGSGSASGGSNYTSRAPRDVVFTFDDNRARRCVQLGRTLYIAGGLILQCDGSQILELGWQIYPWDISALGSPTGAIADGQYGVKVTQRWDNAQGERDRSTTATTLTITMAGGPQGMTIGYTNLFVTRKTSPATAIEIWRTTVAGSVYHLSSSTDPTKTTPNQYLNNDLTTTGLRTFKDELSDAALVVLEEYPETGGVLEDLPPPAANIIAASDTRLFLADVAGQPDTVWYSKQRADGHVASFNDALTFSVPSDGGRITAIGPLEGGIVVWRESATYLFSGAGFDNTGTGGNYTLARIVSTTNGALSMESVAYGDTGWFVRTNNGWYLLDKAFNYTYVGIGVYAYDDEPVLASVMLTGRTQFRVVTPNRVLVLDMIVNKWTEWTIADGLDMLVDSSGVCWYLTPTGPRQELDTWAGYAATDYTLTLAELETAWVKPDGKQQGRYVVDYLQLLGEYRSSCVIRGQLAKDFEYTAPDVPNFHTDKTWTPTPAINGNALELRMSPVKKRCAAIKARITIRAVDGVSPLGGPCVRLTSLTGQFAVEPGIYAALSSGQKQ